MKFIKLLPYNTVINGDDELDCAVWQSKKNICDFCTDQENVGDCDNSGHYYGTSDEREPKFCARHFYQRVANGDGVTNYGIVSRFKDRQYIAEWGEGYTHEKAEIVGHEKFCHSQGYSTETIEKIQSLEVGETLNLSDLSGVHTVQRIEDKKEVNE